MELVHLAPLELQEEMERMESMEFLVCDLLTYDSFLFDSFLVSLGEDGDHGSDAPNDQTMQGYDFCFTCPDGPPGAPGPAGPKVD